MLAGGEGERESGGELSVATQLTPAGRAHAPPPVPRWTLGVCAVGTSEERGREGGRRRRLRRRNGHAGSAGLSFFRRPLFARAFFPQLVPHARQATHLERQGSQRAAGPTSRCAFRFRRKKKKKKRERSSRAACFSPSLFCDAAGAKPGARVVQRIPPTMAAAARPHPLPLVLDADPGHDDALAIVLAGHTPGVDLLV